MKKVVLIITILMSIFSTTQAQFQAFQKITPKESPCVDFNYYGTTRIDSSFGIFFFSLTEKGWAEAYTGLIYNPTSWLELTLGAGIEQAPSLYRLAGSVWMGSKKIDGFFVGEKGDGPDNWWYKTFLRYKYSEKVNFGLMSWRYSATGPFIGYQLSKKLELWVNVGRDLEFHKDCAIVGFNFNMK